jgi:hypothetical protein
VASRLRAEGVDCYRGGKDQSSREKSGELSTDRKLTSACHTKPETFKLYIEILKRLGFDLPLKNNRDYFSILSLCRSSCNLKNGEQKPLDYSHDDITASYPEDEQ